MKNLPIINTVAEKRKAAKPIWPTLVGSMTAFATLASAVLIKLDTFETIFRTVVAFLAGHFAGAVWDALFGTRSEEPVVSITYEVQPSDLKRPDSESTDAVENAA